MSRVFLLSTNTCTQPYPVYPLGMAVIASALTSSGHDVLQFDSLVAGPSPEVLHSGLQVFDPDFVCLSLRNIDDMDSFSEGKVWYLAEAQEQVRLIRLVTDAPIIVGGPAFSIMPKEILDFLKADFGLVGEGDRLICSLIADLSEGRQVRRIIWQDGHLLTGSEMVPPVFDQAMVDFYMSHGGMLGYQTKRGCPFACSYCTYPKLEGACFRSRDPHAVVEGLVKTVRDHDVSTFFFVDSVFNDPYGHHLEIAEEILRRELSIRWSAYFRPQGVDRQQLALLKRSGLYAIEFGTDASSDVTLAAMGKGLTFEDIFVANSASLAEHIPCAHFIIFGGPGETLETVTDGLGNIDRLGKSVVFAFSGIRIFKNTDLYARALSEGVVSAEDSLLSPVYYMSPLIDQDVMNKLVLSAFSRERNRIFPPSAGQDKKESLRRMGFRGLLWDGLISFRGAGPADSPGQE